MPDDAHPPAPGFTPTGYQRTQGGSIKWVPPSAEHLGKLLPQYEIEGLLGRGGMGAVYRARQKSLDRLVAIKILPPDIADEEMNFAERFKNEARTMAKMNHPAIVHVYDYGETSEGQLYIVMEYIDGTDVARMILSQGRLPSEHALAITAHVCDALQYAHKHGVIHRDIKPANILIDMEGAVKVADFGLAKAMDAGQSGLTQTNMAVGTPDYVAPEALMSGINVDGRADFGSCRPASCYTPCSPAMCRAAPSRCRARPSPPIRASIRSSSRPWRWTARSVTRPHSISARIWM